MTYGQLKGEIFNLNWEDENNYSENPLIIPQAINRAIAVISNEVQPIVKRLSVSYMPIESVATPKLSRGEWAKYSPNGKGLKFSGKSAAAYAFECDGEGVAKITDDNGSIEIAITKDKRIYRGFLKGNAEIEFGGEYTYILKSFAIYAEVFSGKQEEIPLYSPTVEFDLAKLTNGEFIDFFGKIYASYQDKGEILPLKEYEIKSRSLLCVNAEKAVDLTIFYKSGFEQFTLDTPDSYEIPLEKESQPLLPLLASYFVWLDDERSRAQEYYNQYELRRAAIIYKEKRSVATVISHGEGYNAN